MPLSRRLFLAYAAGITAASVIPISKVLGRPKFSSYPFTLGVASGYPHPGGFVLWTRLAPEPLAGGGMARAAIEVEWEIATDETFRQIVRRGKEIAVSGYAHSVHAEVAGLEPSRWYWYRFRAGGEISLAARTRTAPAAGAEVDRLRFAFASCQQYEQGYFTAYRHLASEDLDLVVHLGDYIYESSWGRNHVRAHNAAAPVTLEEYRNRYALYKSDADLQSAHAALPWIVTWDDHEVQNDYANDRSQHLDPRALFLMRRAAAYQAYYEHMPLPASMRPWGPSLQLYMRAAFGRLAEFSVLDTRQYRSPQVCARPGRGGGTTVDADECRARLDPALTMLGATQEKWLQNGLAASGARWNVIAQQTLMAQADRMPGAGQQFWTDGWDGYPQARTRMLNFIASQHIRNPIVIGGDVHMSVVADLKTNFDDARAPVVATEFVGTSITSQGPSRQRIDTLIAENPHIRFANGARRGYTLVELKPQRCLTRLRAIDNVSDPHTRIRDFAVFAVEDGRPGAQKIQGTSD